MRVVDGLTGQGPLIAPSVLTIGNFDGVHRGHQAILRAAGALAHEHRVPLVVLTFEPHPANVLRPDQPPPRLGTREQKLAALASAGADAVVIAKSTPELFAIEARTFLCEHVVRRFAPRCIVEGNNFRFGHDRAGDIATLRALEGVGGYRTCVVDPVHQDIVGEGSVRISSSLVRRLLLAGKVAPAAAALGRPYALAGLVERGAGRGVQLGFPTANIRPGEVLVPADGVYAGTIACAGGSWPAAISIGSTPTFAGGARQIEGHLLDFSGDLYGQEVCVHFTHLLRGQQRFESAAALVAQVRADVARVRELSA